MHVTVCTIDPKSGHVHTLSLEVPTNTTVAQALSLANITYAPNALAIFNRKVTPETTLCDEDRIDVGAALNIDPKSIRRLRAMNPRFTEKGVLARHGGKHQLAK